MLSEKLREDFPALRETFSGRPVIYFDNACVTLRPRQVIEAVLEYYQKHPACGGRSEHRWGKLVTQKYQEAREDIAGFIGAKAKEIVFTKNTTEGLNLVAHSLGLKEGDRVLTADREHNSNLLPWQTLAKKGVKHQIVPSRPDMTFDMEQFERMMGKDVKLVSMFHTSNLDGYTIPAREIIKVAHDWGALVMLDGAQSAPHQPVNVRKLDVDFFAFSGHKMLGPAGTGVLYGKYHLLEGLQSFMLGGDTVESSTYTSHKLLKPPEKFEAGLQNYAGVIGLAAAARYLDKIGKENIQAHELALNKLVTQELADIPGTDIIGPPGPELRGGIVSFNVKGLDFHTVALLLDESANIMLRSGQHCVHSWFAAHRIPGSVRASFYLYNTVEEAKVFTDTLKDIAKMG